MQISDPVNLKLMAQNEPPRKVTALPDKVKALLVNAPTDDQVVPSGSGDNNIDTDITTDIATDIATDSDEDRLGRQLKTTAEWSCFGPCSKTFFIPSCSSQGQWKRSTAQLVHSSIPRYVSLSVK